MSPNFAHAHPGTEDSAECSSVLGADCVVDDRVDGAVAAEQTRRTSVQKSERHIID